jgi:hypothetical protein
VAFVSGGYSLSRARGAGSIFKALAKFGTAGLNLLTIERRESLSECNPLTSVEYHLVAWWGCQEGGEMAIVAELSQKRLLSSKLTSLKAKTKQHALWEGAPPGMKPWDMTVVARRC